MSAGGLGGLRDAAERAPCSLLSSLPSVLSGEREGAALRGKLVFVDQPAEQVSTADTIKLDCRGRRLVVRRGRRV